MYNEMEPGLGHSWWEFSSPKFHSRCPTCWMCPAQAGRLCLSFPRIAPGWGYLLWSSPELPAFGGSWHGRLKEIW